MSPWASYLTSLGLGFHSFESTFLKELLQGLSGLIPVTMGWEDPPSIYESSGQLFMMLFTILCMITFHTYFRIFVILRTVQLII